MCTVDGTFSYWCEQKCVANRCYQNQIVQLYGCLGEYGLSANLTAINFLLLSMLYSGSGKTTLLNVLSHRNISNVDIGIYSTRRLIYRIINCSRTSYVSSEYVYQNQYHACCTQLSRKFNIQTELHACMKCMTCVACIADWQP